MDPKVIRAEAHEHYIAVTYVNRDRRGARCLYEQEHTDFIYTSPVGCWGRLIFEGDECDYVSFLDTMVYKNIDVYKKMAWLLTRSILEGRGNRLEVLDAMSELDPTFTPPVINAWCKWQMTMVETMVRSVFHVITTSYSKTKLRAYVNILKRLDPR
jgi:hypothetical protein